MKKKRKICVAPLDWGLGHATRMIPLIEVFSNYNAEVFLAGNEKILKVLCKHFPENPYIEISGYNPEYNNSSMVMAMAKQSPAFLKTIYHEEKLANDLQNKYQWEFILSDNRYAFRAKDAYNIFITHQLKILMPEHLQFLQPVIDILNRTFINKFDECWVPDLPGENNLTGRLAHGQLKIPKHYIGSLSRINHSMREFPDKPNFKILAIISGPEPQRTVFQSLIVNALINYPEKSVIAAGVPESQNVLIKGNAVIHDFMDTETLQEYIQKAEIIISRSGYSTIMDLMSSGKKAVFIPTPGQTEQEYLAEKLQAERIAPFFSQNLFDINVATDSLKNYFGFKPTTNNSNLLDKKVRNMLGIN